MNPAVGIAAFAAVSLATAVIGFYGLRISRTTGDFYVASRTVRPWWNASAIGGEYLSAASFLGVAGLILLSGTDALWFPVGYTAGYLMLLLFVAAPLRRSGAYTIPDFTEARLDSRVVRSVTSVVVVMVGWLYIVPQLHGAALAIRITTGLPAWVGMVAVVAVVCVTVVAGGMRSITFVQAFQYWLKLTALAVPILFIVFVLADSGTPAVAEASVNPTGAAPAGHVPEHFPAGGAAVRDAGAAARAGALLHEPGRAVGPPDHPDRPGPAVGLLPVPDGVRADRPDVRPATWRRAGRPTRWCCCCPGELVGGMAGDLLSALVVAGAFAAFLSTTSGLVVSLAGVISQDLLRRQRAGLPPGGRDLGGGPAGHRVHDGFARAGRERGDGVCVYRVDDLPGAAAGHLVARADRRRGDRRHGDGGRAVRRGDGGRGRAGCRRDRRPGWRSPPPGRCRQRLP